MQADWKLKEADFLDSVAETYVTSASPQDRAIKSLAMRAFAPFARGRALELGCSDGYMSGLIAEAAEALVVVDGSRTQLTRAQANAKRRVTFVESLFEDYAPDQRFDCIFACYILEHVMDPVALLKQAGQWLAPDGKLCLVVPNARAQSRQLARHMGLIDDLYALTENDHRHGHRRVYDRALLDRDIAAAGLVQIAGGGLMLKPFADFQMDTLFETGLIGEAQLNGLYKMGLDYPELAGSLWSVCAAKR